MQSRSAATTVVTSERAQPFARDGRLGHESKNIISGMLLAAITQWSYVPPPSTGALGFREVDNVLELQRLVTSPPRIRMVADDSILTAWRQPGACPPNWPVVYLNDTGFAGIEHYADFRTYLDARVPGEDTAPRLCIKTVNGFRLHLHHAYAWEQRGLAPLGTYSSVKLALRRAFHGRLHEDSKVLLLPPGIGARSSPRRAAAALASRRGRVAIHVRRGDKASRGAANRYPLELVRAFASLLGHTLLGTALFPLGVDVRIYTEPNNSSELFRRGCPTSLGSGPDKMISCEVTSGSVQSDLKALVTADVLGLSSSSFSILAYYLRHDHQPALSPVKTIAQFFAALDGSDGRNLSVARRPTTPPPHNMLFVHQVLQQALLAGDASAQDDASAGDEGAHQAARARALGSSSVSSSDAIGVSLLMSMKSLTKGIQKLLMETRS